VSKSQLSGMNSYGFVGAIAGANYGKISGSGGSISSYVFAHSGTAGGLVGANFGTVTDFTLGSSFRLYAWEPLELRSGDGIVRGTNTGSFNYGGLVGFNYEGPGARILFLDVNANNMSGLINNCTLTGAYQASNGQTGAIGWNTASVYVYDRYDWSDTNYNSDYYYITTGSAVSSTGDSNYGKVSSKSNYINSQSYLCMGGICGYSTGRIYNCKTQNVRITTPPWRFSYDSVSSLGAYTWQILGGLICGYFDPLDADIKGWDMYGVPSGDSEDGSGEFYATGEKKYNNNRIQSCVANTCSININGNVWMDHIWDTSKTQSGDPSTIGDDISKPIGISVAGIVGAVSKNGEYKDFAVNSCKAVNIKLEVYFQAYGSRDGGGSGSKTIGWNTGSYTKKKFLHETTYYFARCLRPYCLFEVNVAAISSGLYGNEDSGYSEFCYRQNVNQYYTPHSGRTDTYQDLGSDTGWGPWAWGDDGAGGLDSAWMRYVKYYDDIADYINTKPKSYLDSNITRAVTISLSGGYNAIGASGYSYAFKDGNVIKTDPDSGFLYCVNKINEDSYAYYNDNTKQWISSATAPPSGLVFPTVG